MSRSKKSCVVFALVLIGLGLSLVLTALIISGFSISSFSSLQFTETSREIKSAFDSIRIEEIDCSVSLFVSPDENAEWSATSFPIFSTPYPLKTERWS